MEEMDSDDGDFFVLDVDFKDFGKYVTERKARIWKMIKQKLRRSQQKENYTHSKHNKQHKSKNKSPKSDDLSAIPLPKLEGIMRFLCFLL